MGLNAYYRKVDFLCLLLTIGGIIVLPRINTSPAPVPQFKQGQGALWPANVGYKKPFVYNYHQQQQQQQNQRKKSYQPVLTTQQNNYGQGAFNKTRNLWQRRQPPTSINYPETGHSVGNLNNPFYNFNQTIHYPILPRSLLYQIYPPHGKQSNLNQSRPLGNAPTYYPEYPSNRHSYNITVPNATPLEQYRKSTNSNSLTPSKHQSNLYPPQPNLDQTPSANGYSDTPLAPFLPLSHRNWYSGGQAVTSYGTGQYQSSAGNAYKNIPPNQGSSNPYGNVVFK